MEETEEVRARRFLCVADKLLGKVEQLAEEEGITPANLKTLTDVMKSIKEVQMIKSRRELQELDLKIEKQRKELGKAEGDGNTVTVILQGTEEFAQ